MRNQRFLAAKPRLPSALGKGLKSWRRGISVSKCSEGCSGASVYCSKGVKEKLSSEAAQLSVLFPKLAVKSRLKIQSLGSHIIITVLSVISYFSCFSRDGFALFDGSILKNDAILLPS